MNHPSAHLAVDLGAESGRAIVGVLADDRLVLHELHRFGHAPVSLPGGLHWDVTGLWREIRHGLAAAVQWCRARGVALRSVGVDTWGVDYALLGRSGQLLGLPFCYRDRRTEPVFQRFMRNPGADAIYDATGVQHMPLNTLYQLAAHVEAEPKLVHAADRLLFMPDLFHYWLSGVMRTEASIASTSQMLDAATGQWAVALLDQVGVPHHLLAAPTREATVLGRLRADVAAGAAAADPIDVVLPASHDTASAVAAVPAQGDDWCYLSSGTWSLLGAELESPCLTAAARAGPFTNERGVGGTIRFLKNLTGLWMVQECRRALRRDGFNFDYDQLTQLAAASTPFRTLVDVEHPDFAATGDMPARIRAFARRTRQPVPESPGQFVRACLEGLALAYRRRLELLEQALGRRFNVIHVVGGGARNALLNQMTADATGRAVVVGPIEATAAGNVLVQAMGSGLVRDRRHVRRIAAASFSPATVTPGASAQDWAQAQARIPRAP